MRPPFPLVRREPDPASLPSRPAEPVRTGLPSRVPILPAHLLPAHLGQTLRPAVPRWGVMAFGDPRIDAHLPGGGLALGQLHEIGGAGVESETGALAAGFAASLAGRIAPGRPVFWIAQRADLYAHGLPGFGLDPARLVLVRPDDDAGTLAAMETALREGAAGVVVGEVGRLDRVTSRRLLLACLRQGATCLLLRRWPHGRRTEDREASLVATRWRRAPVPRQREGREPGPPRWHLALTQARGGRPGEWIVEAAGGGDDAAHPVRVVAALADPAPEAERRAG